MNHLYNTLALTTLLSLRAAAIDETFPPAPVGTFPPAPDDLELKTFTSLTKPLPLAIGEVSNTFHKLEIPPGPIAVYGFKADIVEIDPNTNEIIPVPLNEAYLHHHVVGSNHHSYKHLKHKHSPMKPKGMFKGVGFGAGSEARGTPQKFYYPFAFTTLPDEDSWIANVHVINTRQMTTEDAHHCLECPCTSEDVHANGTINDSKRGWNGCNDFLATVLDNDSCHADTYKGGLRCCEHGEYCLEKTTLPEESPISTFYLRYTLTYAEARPENRPLGLAGCCDVTGDLNRTGNVEYDIPQCEDPINKPDECVYELTTIQELHSGNSRAFASDGIGHEKPNDYLDIVYMVGHLHRGGIEVEMRDAETDEVICLSKPTYGNDVGVAGDEKDYLVAMSTCTFNPPRRMSTTDLVRVTARYDSTVAHTGVMSLFYIATAEPVDHDHGPEHGHLPGHDSGDHDHEHEHDHHHEHGSDDHHHEHEHDHKHSHKDDKHKHDHHKDHGKTPAVPMLGATHTEEVGTQEEERASAGNVDASTSSFKPLFVTFSLIAICVGAVKKFGVGRKRGYTPIEAVDISV